MAHMVASQAVGDIRQVPNGSSGERSGHIPAVTRSPADSLARRRQSGRQSALLKSVSMLGLLALLGGCSYVSDELWPTLTGEDPTGKPTMVSQIAPPSAAEGNPQPTLSPPQAQQPAFAQAAPLFGGNNFQPVGVTPGQPTGTFVGQKVQQMRAELGQLQNAVVQRAQQVQAIRNSATQNSQRYHGTVAAINTRLQMGTTPGNPILVSQWNQAQADIDRMASDLAAMNSLGNEVAADSAMATYLLQSTKSTYSISGAIDEDHRQLAVLEDETSKTVVQIDRLLGELSEDVARQTAYVGTERGNLTTLSTAIKTGEALGPALGTRAFTAATMGANAAVNAGGQQLAYAGAGAPANDGRAPLVVIRFDRADVPYQQALYNAVSQALQRRPQAQFDVVAVAAGQGNAAQVASNQNQARRNADRVVRSLAEMGLPASRVTVTNTANPQNPANEVHVLVR
ncbi:hypothetical protein [Ferrovibrio sp.]|uniref:hypothetical protein n=1 Tax=Ferrovibrio sp. TaxID=1917215 RepID=UPI0025BC3E79|nr:hypothetical protein [Ferrovibrio sp.]